MNNAIETERQPSKMLEARPGLVLSLMVITFDVFWVVPVVFIDIPVLIIRYNHRTSEGK